MFECEECGRRFEEPEHCTTVEFMGYYGSREAWEEFEDYYCPSCGSTDIEEIQEDEEE